MRTPNPATPRRPAPLDTFRDALVELLDSLDAKLQVDGTETREGDPAALSERASRLPEHLARIGRLAKGKFSGPGRTTAAAADLAMAAHRLDAAFVLYLQGTQGAREGGRETAALVEEIAKVRASLKLDGKS